MNADNVKGVVLNEGQNEWGLIDVRTDNRLFNQNLDERDSEDWDSDSELSCNTCDLDFSSYSEYLWHHKQHVTQPAVSLSPIKRHLLTRLQAGKPIKSRPGPKSKRAAEEVPPPQQPHSPLKLTIKRLSTCREPAFEVVCKKEEKFAAMDEMIPEGHRGSHTPSPTPSDILRSEVNADTDRSTWEHIAYSLGFLAPESLDSTEDQDGGRDPIPPPPTKGKGGRPKSSKAAAKQQQQQQQQQPDTTKEDSGVSSSSDPEPSEQAPLAEPAPSSSIAPAAPSSTLENGVCDSETDRHKTGEQESSDSGCEKDGSEKDFSGFSNRQTDDTPTTTPPTNPSPVGSLTILAPSALNSSVVNGSLPPEPLDSNTVSETFSNLRNDSTGPPPPEPAPPVREGLTVLSPAALGATGEVNLLNLNNTNNDPLGLLRGYVDPGASGYMMETCEVCGDRSENIDEHRAAMGHYKCHMSSDCSPMLFTSASELTNHQHITHGIIPPAPPPPPPSLQQLHQQVQRLPVPYGLDPGVGTPQPSASPSFSPGFRPSSIVSISYPQPPGAPPARTPPFQPSIQLRPFAMETSPSTIRPDGSPVASPALPTGLGRAISISPSVKPAQKRASPAPVVMEPPKRSRPESPDCELVDVQQKMPTLPSGISLTVRGNDKSKESSGVANILAARGITVTPAANKAPSPAPAPQPSPRSSQPVTTLNLSSAVSIVPANQARGRNVSRQPAPTVKHPTVDLTQDSTPSFNRRNRPQRFTCQVCDKVFNSQDILNQHLTTHRSPGKLPYKCNLCNAQYPTQQAMLQHKQNYHKEAQGQEMALPVVDMKHAGTIQKLSALGIRHCIVLSQLSAPSGGGMFALPVIPMETARNPAVCNLGALGASNVLSLGPAKALR